MKHLRLPHDGLILRDVLLKTIIESNFGTRAEIKTLEAGCGRKWALNSVQRSFKITGVDLERRPPNAKPVKYITHCPECGTLLVRKENEAIHYCPNDLECPPQIKGKIEHFILKESDNRLTDLS